LSWILTIVLATGMLIPVADFTSQRECMQAMELWTLEPGVEIKCFPAEGQWEHKRHRRR